MKELLTYLAALTVAFSLNARGGDDPDEFDRLDGMGKTTATVQVIEWEGNLEIHSSPPGILKSMGLKLDKTNKDKPVMVISYRFNTMPDQPLIRRAILGIKINDGFKAYRDPSADDYDKIVISNNGLSGDMKPYALEPEPKQLYPDGHPALAKKDEKPGKREPASKAAAPTAPLPDEEGTIRPFTW